MDEAVWIETTDGGLLRQLFGHYPTLHNARLTSIDLNRKDDIAIAEVEYSDEAGSGEAELRVRIRLEWHGIHSMDLKVQGQEIMSISFERKEGWIATQFAPCSGVHGRIVAERFEAVLTQAHALASDAEGIVLKVS